MDITLDDFEVNDIYQARELARLRRIADETGNQARAARETAARPTFTGGPVFRRAQLGSAAIGPASSGIVGTGTVRLAVLISNQLYLVYPHVTVTGVVNDTGGNVPAYSLVWIAVVDGDWSIAHSDCVTVYTAPFADQPH